MDKMLKSELIKTFLRLKKIKSGFLMNKNISWVSLMLLKKLELDGNVNGICETLHITKPAVTYILNSFEKEVYITRSIDTNDRRRIVIKLTDKGKKFARDQEKAYERFFEGLLGRFGDSNTKEFISLLNRFGDILNEMRELENE